VVEVERADDEFRCSGTKLGRALALAALVAPPSRPGSVLLQAVPHGLLVRAANGSGSSAQVRLDGFARGEPLLEALGALQVVEALLPEPYSRPGATDPAPQRSVTVKRLDGVVQVEVEGGRVAPVRCADPASTPPAELHGEPVGRVPRERLVRALAPALAASEWGVDGAFGSEPLVRLEVRHGIAELVGGTPARRAIGSLLARTSSRASMSSLLPGRLLRDVLALLDSEEIVIGQVEEAGRSPLVVLECGDARVVLRTVRSAALARATMREPQGAPRLEADREPLLLEVRRATMLTAASGEARPLVALRPEDGGLWVIPLLREGAGRASSGWVPGVVAERGTGGVYEGQALTAVLESESGDRVVFSVGGPGAATAVEDVRGSWYDHLGVQQLIRRSALHAGG
jgi:hypothetical protein